MTVVAAFVHVSDLHIGHFLPDGDAPLPTFAHVHSWFDGQFGHDQRALAQLDRFWRRQGLPARANLIVTGDLTAFGDPAQFGNADLFLRQRSPRLRRIGLGVGDWTERAVAGNHDQWPGPLILGPASGALAALLPSFPRQVRLAIGSPPIAVRLLRMDTDALTSPFGSDRVLARGRFVDQIATLESDLPPGNPDREVRVLLMHHSISFRGYVCGISGTSKRRLIAFLRSRDVRVVSSGHTHRPNIETLDHLGLPDVLEACCGTTTQRTELPASLPAPLRGGRRHTGATNVLIWHELVVDGGVRQWRARACPRSPLHGFAWAPIPGQGHVQGQVAV